MTSQQVNFARSFSYMFEDKDWVQKILIGGVLTVLSLILVGIFIVLGYVKALFRRIVFDGDETLPGWDKIGDYLVDGVKVFLIILIYSAPYWVLQLGIGAVSSAVSFVAPVWLPTAISFTGCCCLWPLSILIWIVLPAGLARFYATENFASAFEFQAIFDFIRTNLTNYVILIIVMLVAGIIASLGIIAFIIGVFFTMFYAFLVQTHTLAQVWKLSQAETPKE